MKWNINNLAKALSVHLFPFIYQCLFFACLWWNYLYKLSSSVEFWWSFSISIVHQKPLRFYYLPLVSAKGLLSLPPILSFPIDHLWFSFVFFSFIFIFIIGSFVFFHYSSLCHFRVQLTHSTNHFTQECIVILCELQRNDVCSSLKRRLLTKLCVHISKYENKWRLASHKWWDNL